MVRIKLKNIRKYEQRTISETYDEYINYCISIGQRPLTIVSKKRFYIYSLLKWVDEQSTLDVFNRKLVENMVITMRRQGYKGNTYQTFIIKLKAFLTYCFNQNYIEEFEVKIPSVDLVKKTVYTEEELNTLLKKPNLNKCLVGDYKGWATINFLLATGCRAETLLNIRVKDIDFQYSSILFVHMKTRKEITVPMSASLKVVLKEYIQVLSLKKEDLLFSKLNGEKMSYDTLHQNIKNYFDNKNVKMRGINTFRNTFATLFIKAGGDIYRLKILLGHSNIKTTERYINLLPLDFQENLLQYNPLDILSKNNKRLKINNLSSKRGDIIK